MLLWIFCIFGLPLNPFYPFTWSYNKAAGYYNTLASYTRGGIQGAIAAKDILMHLQGVAGTSLPAIEREMKSTLRFFSAAAVAAASAVIISKIATYRQIRDQNIYLRDIAIKDGNIRKNLSDEHKTRE